MNVGARYSPINVPVRNQHQRYGGGGSTFYFVALAPSPPVQSVGYYLRRKNGGFDFNAYLVLVYLINVNI